MSHYEFKGSIIVEADNIEDARSLFNSLIEEIHSEVMNDYYQDVEIVFECEEELDARD